MRNYRKSLAGIAAIAMLLNTAPAAIPQMHSMLSVAVSAAEEESLYTYESNGTSITITGVQTDATNIIIPETIDGLPVTSIVEDAFAACDQLGMLTLPASITAFCIDNICVHSANGTLRDVIWEGTLTQWEDAIYNIDLGVPALSARLHIREDKLVMGVYNTYLHYISYTEQNYVVIDSVVNRCDSELPITDVVIPAEIDGVPVRDIAPYTFEFQVGITSVTLPESIRSIGPRAFMNCKQLETVTLPPLAMSSIGESAFAQCDALKNITLPQLVSSIGANAFSRCTSLTEINWPSAADMSVGVFSGCSALTTVHLSSGVEEIPYNAFSGCTALTDVYFNNTEDAWKEININAMGNEALDTATIHYAEATDGVYGDFTYRNVNDKYVIITGLTEDAKDVTDLTIPLQIGGVQVSKIADYAFAGKDNLLSVTLPQTVTSIGDYAFQDCTRLAVCNIPDQVHTIGKYAFQNCILLQGFITPSRMSVISEGCFSGCLSLKSVLVNHPVAKIEAEAFRECSKLTSLHLPISLGSIGQNAFYSCAELKDVYYEGSEEYWNDLLPRIESGNTPFVLEGTTIHFAGYEEATDTGLTYYRYWDHVEIMDADPAIVTANIPAQIEGLPVTMIGAMAFEDCTNLETVTIPETVTTIGAYAFHKCTSLKEVIVPEQVTNLQENVFAGCTALTDAVIEAPIGALPTSTFFGCNSLVNVTLPDTIAIIRPAAFFGCTSLAEIDLPDNLTAIDDYAFESCTALKAISLPDTLTDIHTNAFAGCTAMTEIAIPASVIRIQRAAFSGSGITKFSVDAENQKYQSIDGVLFNKAGTYLHCYPSGKKGPYTVPEGVLVIDTEAFVDAKDLRSVTLPDSIVTIMDRAFQGCTGLTKFHIPASLQSIRGNVFAGCTGLTEFTVEDGNMDYAVADGMLTEPEMERLVCCPASKAGSVTIPEEITQLAVGAFSGCTQLTEIILHDGITSIGRGAFENCTGLTSMELPVTLDTLPEMAFSGCTGLESIKIPNKMTEIPYSAFEDCTSLTEISLPAGITDVRLCAFQNCTSLTTVNYDGTEEQWNAVNIESNNDALLNAAVNFSQGLALGDLDGDGAINTTDAAILLMDAATEGATGISSLTDAQKAAADVNSDGKRNASDASVILHYAAYIGTGGTDPIEVFVETLGTAME